MLVPGYVAQCSVVQCSAVLRNAAKPQHSVMHAAQAKTAAKHSAGRRWPMLDSKPAPVQQSFRLQQLGR